MIDPAWGSTWGTFGDVSVFTTTRIIRVGSDMTCLQMYRRVQEILETVDGLWWDQILVRKTDYIFDWYGEPYDIVGPGKLREGVIADTVYRGPSWDDVELAIPDDAPWLLIRRSTP